MKISRHAKNNMRLYGINETDILETIESPDLTDYPLKKKHWR